MFSNRERVTGRLISLAHYEDATGARAILEGSPEAKNIVINFPAMPDVITLARRANYNVTSVFTTPDGWHQYQNTEPLEIPISFKLYANDDYCLAGGLSILTLAAKLHALILPIGDSARDASYKTVTPAPTPNLSPDQKAVAAQSQAQLDLSTPTVGSERVYFPVAVKLDLIYTDTLLPGISCVGYVKDVSVRLYGPWLQPPPGFGYNVPTWAEYDFTFVHRPSHTNAVPNASRSSFFNPNIQAYADDVRTKLYNSVDLIRAAGNIVFQGLSR